MIPSNNPKLDENFSVSGWLASNGFSQYAVPFAENEITPDLLFILSEADLEKCGVDSLGHRKKLLFAIAQLKIETAQKAASAATSVLQEKTETPAPAFATAAPAAPERAQSVASSAPAAVPASSIPYGAEPEPVQVTRVFDAVVPAPVPLVEAQMPQPPASAEAVVVTKRTVFDRFGGRFLYISIIAHIIFGLVATWFVVQRIEAKRKLTFQAGNKGPNQNARAMEHKVQVTKKKNTMSAPAQAKRITTAAVTARVSIPDMKMPMTSDITPSRMAGSGGQGMALGAVMGGGAGGGGGGGAIPFFGLRTKGGSNALVGTLYDMKQNRAGKPTDMAGDLSGNGGVTAADRPLVGFYYTELKKMVRSNFGPATLAKYYRAPEQLFTSQIFIPRMPAGKGPEEFGVADKVKPKRWVVHYQANVTPPVSGRYHFVGHADDVMLVKFDGHLVLDGSLYDASNGWEPKRVFTTEPMLPERTVLSRAGPSTLAEGNVMDVQAGRSYALDVLIGECPGGEFTAILLLEKEGEEYTKDKRGNPILPIFKVAPGVLPPTTKPSAPYFEPDTAWSVWKASPPAQQSGGGLDFFKSAP